MNLPKLIILDRDGVLNEMVVDAVHGTVDSPLNVDQVRVVEGVSKVVREMGDAGIRLFIATNQPSAKKGKTTFDNLHAVNTKVVSEIIREGGKIMGFEICFDTSEEKSEFRKPAPGMLLKILAANPDCTPSECWMVGDGVTDVEAGVRAGMKTAFLGPKKSDAYKVFEDRLKHQPDFWGRNLADFWLWLKGLSS